MLAKKLKESLNSLDVRIQNIEGGNFRSYSTEERRSRIDELLTKYIDGLSKNEKLALLGKAAELQSISENERLQQRKELKGTAKIHYAAADFMARSVVTK